MIEITSLNVMEKALRQIRMQIQQTNSRWKEDVYYIERLREISAIAKDAADQMEFLKRQLKLELNIGSDIQESTLGEFGGRAA